MASSEVSDPQPLRAADASAGLALSAAAGWNQTVGDWHLFLTHGHTVGCRDAAGRLVATAAALPYGGGQGWISMVLVDPAHRHQGLATRLMDRCVQALRSQSIAPVLDATPAGAQVYRRIGFVPGFELDRWEGDARGDDAPAPVADLQAVQALDHAATGLDRGFVLGDFLRRAGSGGWLSADGDGFVLARRGHRAWQLGPLVARDEAAAGHLLRQALASRVGRVFLDVPRRWAALTDALASMGFARQRGFVRMAWSAPGGTGPAVPDRVFLLAGPEFG